MPTIVINTEFFDRFLSAASPADVMIQLFLAGGWVVFAFVLLWGFWKVWHESRQIKFISAQTGILLAIDVPKTNDQTPKAVESVFITLSGALSVFDRIENYWHGKMQAVFSLEIVSIDGYVQFYARTWTKYRDVVESAIYAQYPDAEISEVVDYVLNVPKVFPAPGWDLFGTEFVLMNKGCFPIRTYTAFEHNLSEFYFKDPLGVLLETLSKLKTGEQVWIQILIRGNNGKAWREAGNKVVQKLVGAREKVKKSFLGEFGEIGKGMLDQVLANPNAAPPKAKKEEPPTLMQHLSPGEKVVIENVQMKLAKIPFETKLRIIYVGKKEAFSKARTISGLKGVFGQYTILDSNGFRIYGNVVTKSDYWWQRKLWVEPLSLYMTRTLTTRQNSILRAYRNRSMGIGAPPFILNVEELATIYHFPMTTVKAPLLKKTEAKRGEAPFSLPIAPLEAEFTPPPPPSLSPKRASIRKVPAPGFVPTPPPNVPTQASEGKPTTPDNLPFV